MNSYLLVFIGGGIGSLLRLVVGRFVTRMFPMTFPIGTFVVNVLACVLLGLFAGVFISKFSQSENWRMFVAVGVCGGFSTFSSFSLENIELMRSGHFVTAFAYVMLSVACCLLATWAGAQITK